MKPCPVPQSMATTNNPDEELPPAYTATADVQHGESTFQYGPRRPFQPAPPPVNTLTHNTSPTSPSPHAPPLPPRPAPISDFTRDFYAAGPAPEQQQPPAAATSASASSSSSTSTSNVGPTTTPTPGRVLLHNGKMLVYPKAFVCPKCMLPSFFN